MVHPSSRVCSVKASSGELLTNESKVNASWAEYFKQLYQVDLPATPLEISTMPLEVNPPINCDPLSVAEMQAVVR